uniref:Aminopeptidase n=1 Tax=Fopius arisanus TaxID=64838 RepID=A0A0C9R2S6_9HYME
MAYLLSLLAAIVAVTCAGIIPPSEDEFLVTKAAPEAPANPLDYRLPTNVVPTTYEIKLAPDLENFTFKGESKIMLSVKKATKQIVLHAKDLKITLAVLHVLNGTTHISNVATTALPINTTNDWLVINLIEQLNITGTYQLELHYEGTLNEDLKGFYRSSYIDDYGKKRWLATTHFEPTSARLAFPCWDEPHLKAKFTISIKHPKKLHALSNSHLVSITPDVTDKTSFITQFAETPAMSTYLVAFVVSDFESLSNKEGTFTVWARPNAIRHGEFALDVGEKELKELEKATNIAFSTHGFTKMDSIAIPQFAAGAMENWGLVTYRESALLVEEGVTTTTAKVNVASTISHELAHQWFGNLVSPQWWQYTWLNEGFATYFQYIITDLIEPTWRMKELQVVVALQDRAFPSDSVNTTVDMNHDVSSPTEISAKFNSISYQKAGSIIRMINHVFGEEKFKKALQAYLSKYKSGTATSDQLFAEFATVSPTLPGTQIKPQVILNDWATTPGFPYITVTRNYTTGKATIKQERYLYKPEEKYNEVYYVPINYASEKKDFEDTSVNIWLEKNKPIVDHDLKLAKDKWVIFNKQHFGYYRVNYDENNWKLITEFLKTKNYTDIHVLNRGQVVDDALNLARIGKLTYRTAFGLLDFLKQDFDYVPWHSALTGFAYLQKTLKQSAIYNSFKQHLLALLGPVVNNVTFYESPADGYLRKLLRVKVLESACALGSKPCRDQASKNVTDWLKDPKAYPLSPDLKGVVLCAAVRNADQALWNKLYAKYLAGEENALLRALACSSNNKILEGYLTKALSASVSTENRDEIFSAVTTSSEEGVNNVALDFVLANANKIYELSGNTTKSLKTYVTNIGSQISSAAQLKKASGSV